MPSCTVRVGLIMGYSLGNMHERAQALMFLLDYKNPLLHIG